MKYYSMFALVLVVIVAIAVYVAPVYANEPLRVTAVLAITTAIITLAAIPLFLISLKKFKVQLRKAYLILCMGIGLLGIAQAQLPVLSWFNWWAVWADTGGVAVPYLVATVLILLGIRKFALLLKLHSPWISLSLATFLAVTLAVASIFLPHIPSTTPEPLFDAAIALSLWDTVFIGFAAAATWQIRHYISKIYVPAITWIAIAFTTLTFAGAHFAIISLLFTDGHWYVDYSLTIVPFLIGGFLLMRAGYAFNQTTPAKPLTANITIIDLVVYVASLASNPRDIDPLLDELRQITARLQTGEKLNKQDEAKLEELYRKLSQYLITDEPLRIFTKKGLYQDIKQRFTLDPQLEEGLFKASGLSKNDKSQSNSAKK